MHGGLRDSRAPVRANHAQVLVRWETGLEQGDADLLAAGAN